MLRLYDFQQVFGQNICGAGSGNIGNYLHSPIGPLNDILAIHRNNFRLTLSEALASIYPATVSLVGQDCFSALAGSFVEQYPPSDPVLSLYGSNFADWLEARAELSDFPYLPGIARLEWTWNTAFHAPDAEPMTPDMMMQLASDGQEEGLLALHPSLHLIKSDYPVSDIREFALNPASHPDGIRLEAGPSHIMILRPELQVQISEIDSGSYALLQALQKTSDLTEAIAAAIEAAPCFAPESSIGALLNKGAFISTRPQT